MKGGYDTKSIEDELNRFTTYEIMYENLRARDLGYYIERSIDKRVWVEIKEELMLCINRIIMRRIQWLIESYIDYEGDEL